MKSFERSLEQHESYLMGQVRVSTRNPVSTTIGSLTVHTGLCNAALVAMHYCYEHKISRCGNYGGSPDRLPTFGNAGGEIDWEEVPASASWLSPPKPMLEQLIKHQDYLDVKYHESDQLPITVAGGSLKTHIGNCNAFGVALHYRWAAEQPYLGRNPEIWNYRRTDFSKVCSSI